MANILICDLASVDVCRQAALLLEGKGHKVTIASKASEVLLALENDQVDILVLSDVFVPDVAKCPDSILDKISSKKEDGLNISNIALQHPSRVNVIPSWHWKFDDVVFVSASARTDSGKFCDSLNLVAAVYRCLRTEQ